MRPDKQRPAFRGYEELKTMFDNLSDRLGGVFDKLKGRTSVSSKSGNRFCGSETHINKAALTGGLS
jgi:hypothetical protein